MWDNIEYAESQKAGSHILYIRYIRGDYTKEEDELAYKEFINECFERYPNEGLSFEESGLSPIYEDDEDNEEDEDY